MIFGHSIYLLLLIVQFHNELKILIEFAILIDNVTFFGSGLDRKISVRATREELIERGILLPDVASVACQPQDRFRDKEASTGSATTTTTTTTFTSTATSNGENIYWMNWHIVAVMSWLMTIKNIADFQFFQFTSFCYRCLQRETTASS